MLWKKKKKKGRNALSKGTPGSAWITETNLVWSTKKVSQVRKYQWVKRVTDHKMLLTAAKDSFIQCREKSARGEWRVLKQVLPSDKKDEHTAMAECRANPQLCGSDIYRRKVTKRAGKDHPRMDEAVWVLRPRSKVLETREKNINNEIGKGPCSPLNMYHICLSLYFLTYSTLEKTVLSLKHVLLKYSFLPSLLSK